MKTDAWGTDSRQQSTPASLSVTVDEIVDGEARISITAGSDPLCVTMRVTLRPGQSVSIPGINASLTFEER